MTRLPPELERLQAARPQAARDTRTLVDAPEREALLAAITADQHSESPCPESDHRGRWLGRPAAKRRQARWGVLAVSTLGVAGVGTAVALVLSATSASPAFAVTPNRDGTVTVKILRSSGIAGANARLSALHVRARIVPAAAGCVTHALQAIPAAQARIDPHKIPPGRTVVIASWRASGRIDLAPVGTAPNGNTGNSGNSGNSGSGASGGSSCEPHALARMAAPGSTSNSGPPSSGNSGPSGK